MQEFYTNPNPYVFNLRPNSKVYKDFGFMKSKFHDGIFMWLKTNHSGFFTHYYNGIPLQTPHIYINIIKSSVRLKIANKSLIVKIESFSKERIRVDISNQCFYDIERQMYIA